MLPFTEWKKKASCNHGSCYKLPTKLIDIKKVLTC